MKNAKIGDIVHCNGILAIINKIFYEYFDGNFWDIEFIDVNGRYFHWKQEFDGGEFIPDQFSKNHWHK